jgi:hypothetical protein
MGECARTAAAHARHSAGRLPIQISISYHNVRQGAVDREFLYTCSTQKRGFGVWDHCHWIRIEISCRFPTYRPRDLRFDAISCISPSLSENRDRNVHYTANRKSVYIIYIYIICGNVKIGMHMPSQLDPVEVRQDASHWGHRLCLQDSPHHELASSGPWQILQVSLEFDPCAICSRDVFVADFATPHEAHDREPTHPIHMRHGKHLSHEASI